MSTSKLLEPLIHGLVWIVAYLMGILWVTTLGPFNSVNNTLFLPITVGTLLNIVLFYSVSLFLIPRYAFSKRAGAFLLKLLLLFAGITLLETVLDYLYFVSLYSTEDEGFSGQLFINLLLNFFILSLALAYGFTKTWLKNEKQRQQLKQEMLQAELNFLKAQVNPHFLFNVLNMAFASASANNDERTAGIIEKLANLMRYMLYESNGSSIELSREISYIESFIELQKLRLSTEIDADIRFKIEGDGCSIRIAPMLLIPFVENAFKHGIRLDKSSDILIQLSIEDKKLLFKVENAIAPTEKPIGPKTGGIGLDNVTKRLNLLYPGNHRLQIYQEGEKFISSLSLTLT